MVTVAHTALRGEICGSKTVTTTCCHGTGRNGSALCYALIRGQLGFNFVWIYLGVQSCNRSCFVSSRQAHSHTASHIGVGVAAV